MPEMTLPDPILKLVNAFVFAADPSEGIGPVVEVEYRSIDPRLGQLSGGDPALNVVPPEAYKLQLCRSVQGDAGWRFTATLEYATRIDLVSVSQVDHSPSTDAAAILPLTPEPLYRWPPIEIDSILYLDI